MTVSFKFVWLNLKMFSRGHRSYWIYYHIHAKYFITLLIKSNMPSTEVTLTWKFEEAFVTWLFSQFGILDKILFILLYHKTSLHFHVRSPREFRCFEIREGFRKTKWKLLWNFPWRGGGSRALFTFFFKKVFFKNHLESFPDCQNVLYT